MNLTERIIELIPEIAGVHVFPVGAFRCKFCKVEKHVRDRKYLLLKENVKTGGKLAEVSETVHDMRGGPCPENARRPIQLHDVLRAIEIVRAPNSFKLSIDTKGYLTRFNYKWEAKEQVDWNFAADLDGQSQETKDFISRILGV